MIVTNYQLYYRSMRFPAVQYHNLDLTTWCAVCWPLGISWAKMSVTQRQLSILGMEMADQMSRGPMLPLLAQSLGTALFCLRTPTMHSLSRNQQASQSSDKMPWSTHQDPMLALIGNVIQVLWQWVGAQEQRNSPS